VEFHELLRMVNMEEILKGVIIMIKQQRGSCMVFTPTRLHKILGLPPKIPCLLSVTAYYLDVLREKGLLRLYSYNQKGGRSKKYIITRESPLWRIAKEYPLEEAVRVAKVMIDEEK